MPDLHLSVLGFTYCTFRQFTKNKEKIQNFREKGDSPYIYQSKLDKASLQHDMVYRDFEYSTRTDKVLHDKAFNTAKNPKSDDSSFNCL